MSRRKTLVIDMDGTICTQVEREDYEKAEPRLEVIRKVNQLWMDGWDVIVFTARGMTSLRGDVGAIEQKYRKMTEEWLDNHRVCYTKVIFGKPSADVYVDDKGQSIEEFVRG